MADKLSEVVRMRLSDEFADVNPVPHALTVAIRPDNSGEGDR